jgi:lysozyme
MADPLVELLLKHEGLRLHPYDDLTGRAPEALRGKLTIGVGRNLTDVGITRTEALSLLKADIHKAKSKAKKYRFFDGLNKARKAVIISMVFNLGSIRAFVRMRGAIAVKDWDGAAREMLENSPGNPTRWAFQVGYRAQELATMMRSGKWEM